MGVGAENKKNSELIKVTLGSRNYNDTLKVGI